VLLTPAAPLRIWRVLRQQLQQHQLRRVLVPACQAPTARSASGCACASPRASAQQRNPTSSQQQRQPKSLLQLLLRMHLIHLLQLQQQLLLLLLPLLLLQQPPVPAQWPRMKETGSLSTRLLLLQLPVTAQQQMQ
jgi:hypothetical protein